MENRGSLVLQCHIHILLVWVVMIVCDVAGEECRNGHAGRCNEGRAAAVRAWRGSQNLAEDDEARESTMQSGGTRKLLIVDLSFGGLSNRRQSLVLAAVAARRIGRRLVLPEYFDTPFPNSFGPCQHCIRPLAFYYNMSSLKSFVTLATYEDLYSWLEDSGSLQVRVACKGARHCMKEPPAWLHQDLIWDSSVKYMYECIHTKDAT